MNISKLLFSMSLHPSDQLLFSPARFHPSQGQVRMEGTIFRSKSDPPQLILNLFLKRSQDFPLVYQPNPDYPWVFQMGEGPYPANLERKWQGVPDGLFNGFEDGVNFRLFNISKEFESEVDLFRTRPPYFCMG